MPHGYNARSVSASSRLAIWLAFFSLACAGAPRPTPANLRIRANPKAVIEGRVRDPEGRPVAGVGVRAIPRGADIPWSAWAETECDGSFRLSLPAPASYGFQLRWKKVSVITPSPQDPARLDVPVAPGERRGGIDLVFLPALWGEIKESVTDEMPSCR